MSEDQDRWVATGPPLPEMDDTRQAGQILVDKMLEYADRITHINATNDESETFGEFRLRCLRAAEVMRSEHAAGPDSPVCVCAGNSADVFCTAVAALLCGAPFNVLDPGLSEDDISHMFGMLRPGLVFCYESSAALIERTLLATGQADDVTVVLYDAESSEPGRRAFADFQQETGTEEEFQAYEFPDVRTAPAVIMCSSGTTGMPKGVKLSHYSFYWNLLHSIVAADALERIFGFSTLYWLSGNLILYSGLYFGRTRIFTTETFTEELCSQIIDKYQPDSVFLPPSNINRIAKFPDFPTYDWSCVRNLLIGGGKVDYVMLAKFGKEMLPNCNLIVGYGMTEVGLVSKKIIEEPALESAGIVAPGVSIKVINPETNESLPWGETGELCIKTDRVMLGYHNNDEATRNTIDEEGWLHSGDAGYVDEAGYIYVTDRYKEMLKYHNWPICPAEIETVLRSHHAVLECCVVGVPYEDHGDLLVAFIMRRPESEVTEQELKDLVAGRLADAKRLRGGVLFLSELPVLPSGKLDRKSIKKQSLEMAEELLSTAEI